MKTAHQRKRQTAFDAVPSDRKYRLRLARYVGLAEAIASYIKQENRRGTFRLLDVGPGSGRSLRFCQAAGIADRLEFTGIDNSPLRVKSIYEPERWTLMVGNAEDGLPYVTEGFDICLCEQVLEHVAKPSRVVAEMARVLCPGGLLIVGVPTFPPGAAGLRAAVVRLLDRWFAIKRPHVQSFTCRSFKKMVLSAGPLQIKACRGFRITSGGLLTRLEDYGWWYRLNRCVGRAVPWLCTEVQLVLLRTAAVPAASFTQCPGAPANQVKSRV